MCGRRREKKKKKVQIETGRLKNSWETFHINREYAKARIIESWNHKVRDKS